ncbi:MAG: flagellar biosynthetic protein FliQ [Ignavibacterium sp.]|nr:flagellar biosynthetic protein FliQ [Ignavibacterium sp.]MCX7610617.1 flagellar biosynthetic protein FliQ [Ignavibacterium sp.]MDW8374135.1 flagellar biosynthetic protein FliQ [Ignavibacteriales bacterium]
MTEQVVIDVLSEAFYSSFYILLPILGVALVVGILVSIFQAATSIQEMTLTFIPKILVTAITVILILPFALDIMIPLTKKYFTIFITLIK